jgi:HK97 family phage major capsid protein
MASNTTTFAPILTPEQVADLVIRPLITESIAGQVLTTVQTGSHNYRIPIVASDPSASWTAEGAEIMVSDADIDELIVTPSKLAALSVISRELANDSSPSAADAIGAGLVRDLSRKLDESLFAAVTVNGPSGLPGLSGISTVSAGAAYTNTDAFSDAIYTAASYNGNITAWICHPSVAMVLSKLKQGTALNSHLLQPDPTMPGRRQILGVPLLTSPYVATANSPVWGISKQFGYLVIRQGVEVESDKSVFFSSDRIAVRAILRAGLGFPAPATVVRIATS